jgi:hypothetical protein
MRDGAGNPVNALYGFARFLAELMERAAPQHIPSPHGHGRNAAHAAIGAEYAHVTAPLRRLADRYATEVCLAYAAGRSVPGWVRSALPELPGTMAVADRRAAAFERGCVDVVEAAVLAGREGERFEGVVVDLDAEPGQDADRGEVMLRDPAVRAPLVGPGLELGQRVDVTLKDASVPDRRVLFGVS